MIGLLLMLWTAPPPARDRYGSGGCWRSHDSEEPDLQSIATIGLDIAKSVFQVHGDADGQVAIRRQLKRRYVMAFCAWSHHWSRELQALGHTGRLMPPAYVKP
jgi:hypothetical protein